MHLSAADCVDLASGGFAPRPLQGYTLGPHRGLPSPRLHVPTLPQTLATPLPNEHEHSLRPGKIGTPGRSNKLRSDHK